MKISLRILSFGWILTLNLTIPLLNKDWKLCKIDLLFSTSNANHKPILKLLHFYILVCKFQVCILFIFWYKISSELYIFGQKNLVELFHLTKIFIWLRFQEIWMTLMIKCFQQFSDILLHMILNINCIIWNTFQN